MPYAEKRLIEAQNALMLGETAWRESDGEWRLWLGPPEWPEYWRAWAEFRWGSATVLALADGLPPGFLPGAAPELWGSLPPVLLAAGLEAWLGRALENFGRGAALPPLVLEEAGLGQKAADRTGDRPGFILSRADGGGPALSGVLAFSPEAAPLLETLAAALAPGAAMGPDEPCDCPVTARLEVGAMALGPAELGSLRPGDILFPDDYFPETQGGPRLGFDLAAGGRLFFSGRAQGPALTLGGWRIMNDLENGLGENPAETAEEAEASESGEALPDEVIDGLAVPVILELDTLSLPLASVRALRPGYVLETSKSVDSPVTIRAAGRVVGTGELLDVAGRVGVRIKRFTGSTA